MYLVPDSSEDRRGSSLRGDGCCIPIPLSAPGLGRLRDPAHGGFRRVAQYAGSEQFEPEKTALVEAGAAPPAEHYGPARIELRDRRPGELRFLVQCDENAFVVISENAFPPGWRARSTVVLKDLP